MSRRSQDIPIRPRYGYTDEADGEEAAANHNSKSQQQRNNCGTPASYSEIPFLAQYAGPVPDHVLQDITPTASVAAPSTSGHDSYVNLDSGEDDNDEDNDDDEDDNDEEQSHSNSKDSSGDVGKPTSRPKSLQSTFPYELEGEGATSSTGAMRHFVAHNLESKLRAATDYSIPSEHTTPSMSTAPISRFLQSRNVPEVDANVLSDIELEAQYLASSVDNLVENLGNLLHSISAITADNVEVHKNAVKKLTDALDANIKCQYQLLAKTEEISKSMRPTEQLSQRIREIKRLVDMLDSTM